MTEFLCKICDHEIFENLDSYIAMAEKKDNNIQKKIVIDKINLDEFDKIFKYYIEIHNKKFFFYIIKCSFNIKFDNLTTDKESNYVYKKECYKIEIELLHYINYMKLKGNNFCKINQMIIIIYSDICNITNEYAQYPISNPIEKRINIIFGKNLQLINQISKNILIRKKSHIIFNI